MRPSTFTTMLGCGTECGARETAVQRPRPQFIGKRIHSGMDVRASSLKKRASGIGIPGRGYRGFASQCTEAELYSQLARLAPDQRRCVLEHSLSERQRLALEVWILRQRASSVVKARGSHRKLRDTRCWNRRLSKVTQTRCISGALPSRRSKRTRSDIPGVHCRIAGRSYRAVVTAAPFRIMSSYSSSLPKVLRFHEVLLAIARRVRRDGAEKLESSIKRAVLEEPQRHGFLSATDVGLTFEVTISARFWIGQGLITPRFSSSQLDAALRAWRRLREARGTYRGCTNGHTLFWHDTPKELETAWARMRGVYLDICSELGRSRRHIASRLNALEEKHRSCKERITERYGSKAELSRITSCVHPSCKDTRASECFHYFKECPGLHLGTG